jgi:uncharacterized protein YecT (DUF1311 family)
MKRTTWIVIGWMALGITAQAASFDCAKAQSKVEHLICDNTEISKLDEELSSAYKIALQDEKQADFIKQAQKQWMKERNGCADVVCVKSAYEVRLSLFIGTHVTSGDIVVLKRDAACLAPTINWRNYEWTLITGNGLPVCEEMLAYVKSRPKDVSPPTCPEERLPPNGNWTRPESRILSEAERQVLLRSTNEAEQVFIRDLPEQRRRKQGGSFIGDYAQQIKSTKLLRVIRGDITRDGTPESFLALGGYEDIQQICERSKRCARPEAIFKNGIVLTSDSYDLLPMNDEGTQVNWVHRTIRAAPILMGGELIYYKGYPYWMTHISWDQSLHDGFAHTSMRANDPYSAIFGLNGLGHSVVGQYGGAVKPAPFSEVQHIRGDGAICRFGYFHRDNLKQNPPNGRK